jgi:hypothetical protein
MDIEQFIADVGLPEKDNYQLDRINTDSDYEPGNVRWVSPTENVRNRSNTKFVTAWGATKPLAQWCDELQLSYNTIKRRLYSGWTPEQALTI